MPRAEPRGEGGSSAAEGVQPGFGEGAAGGRGAGVMRDGEGGAGLPEGTGAGSSGTAAGLGVGPMFPLRMF